MTIIIVQYQASWANEGTGCRLCVTRCAYIYSKEARHSTRSSNHARTSQPLSNAKTYRTPLQQTVMEFKEEAVIGVLSATEKKRRDVLLGMCDL